MDENYRQGKAFRLHEDGSRLEVIGHNFRNNFELAIDSYGSVWQSDNDDDGNASVRINMVMEYGNYGYQDEVTGAAWRQSRYDLEENTSSRHWHQNSPGVVPNLLMTGAGSPSGHDRFRGRMLPPEFRGQMLHAEPGPERRPVLSGEGVRSWLFSGNGRPSAKPREHVVSAIGRGRRAGRVCHGGRLGDPGVGGHRQGNRVPGASLSVGPAWHAIRTPALDLTTIPGAH